MTMRIFLITAMLTLLTGCAQIEKWVPSFWDDNQSHYIIQTRITVEQINCQEPQLPQVQRVALSLRQFELYSSSKGTLQKDVLRVIEPMQASTKEWLERGEASKTYCEIKKKLLIQQGDRASRVILGRW